MRKQKGKPYEGHRFQSPRGSPGRSAIKDMRCVGRSGQAEKGRVKGEAHVKAERREGGGTKHKLLLKEE